MSVKDETAGYFRAARGVFQHVLLYGPFSRRDAWLWLISNAAWKAAGTRRRHGVVHVERGQLAASVRDLAERWEWPQTNVVRFLAELDAEGMIDCGSAFGTRNGTDSGTKKSHRVSLITVCNYNKFQGVDRVKSSGSERNPEQKVEQELPFAPTIPTTYPSEATISKETIDAKRSAERGQREKPRHGAKGRGMVWFDHGSEEWTLYADDFRNTRGVEKLPESRIGGRGNWFVWLGEQQRKRG
jgi:hypothetical protein